jgi:hypothetical protein
MAASRPEFPAFVCAYAASGAGKTTDCGYSFPRALFVAAPNALESIRSTCGYDPSPLRREATTMAQARALIPIAKKGGLDTIVFDDFSYLAEQTFSSIEASWRGKPDLRGMYGQLRTETILFREECRHAGLHVVLNAWEKPPGIRNGFSQRGGPRLPGELPEAMPAMADLVARGATDAARKPWPGVYLTHTDPSWVQKNRFEWVPNPAPMNLGEILRHAGYTIARHAALDWQEEAVEKIAGAFLSAPPDAMSQSAIGRDAFGALEKKTTNPKVIRWTLRDATDRAALRRAAASAITPAVFGW